MRNYVEMFALAWDYSPNSGGTFPLFAFAGSELEIMDEFNARNSYTDDAFGNVGFTISNLTGPTKLYVLLDKEILVRYFNGVPFPPGAGNGNQVISGYLYTGIGVEPINQPWPMVLESPRSKGWTNPTTGKKHGPQH